MGGLTQQLDQRLYTAADLLALAGDGKRRELVRGEIIEGMPTGDQHTLLAIESAVLIRAHIRQHGLAGHVTGEGGGYLLAADPDTVRAPDVGYISKTRAAALTGGFFRSPPELAVEIVSPHDLAGEVQAKVLEYLSAGVLMVWVVYPRTRTITVHTRTQTLTHTATDALEGGEVLPGFSVRVGDLFTVLDE